MAQNYIKIQKIGEGACGTVYKAKDKKTDQFVAMKKFKQLSTTQGIPQNCLRQIQILRSLEFRKDIVGVKNVFMHQSGNVYVIFDYYKCNLSTIISQEFKEWKKFLILIIEAVEGMHQLNIVHRDIKPANILIGQNEEPLLADFGFAKQLEFGQKMTNMVGTQAYRAPQLILGDIRYGKAVDIWSLGCLIYQIFARKALFQNISQISLLDKMLNLFGPIKQIPNYLKQLPNFQCLYNKLNKYSVPINHQILDDIPSQIHELMMKMLDINPKTRISAKQSLTFLK